MVRAAFYTDKSSGSITLRVSGHANAAAKGQDIVCASASILAYMVAQTMEYMYADGCLRKKPRIEFTDGEAAIVAKPKGECFAEALHAFFVAQVGYSLLARNYPQFVELKSFGLAE
jgi:uncharacterized protein YsxB (DUF464 family)